MIHIRQRPNNYDEAGFYGEKHAFYAVSTPQTEPWYKGVPKFTAYTRVYLPININPNTETEMIGNIIGKKGHHLIGITESNSIHYIWYHPDGYFELWGDEFYLPNASYNLMTHINYVVNGCV